MPGWTLILSAAVFATATALSTVARSEEYITVNGLPCGAFCRAWMGIKLPSEDPPRDADAPAPRTREQRSQEERAPRPAVAHHAVKPAKVARPSAPAIKHGKLEIAQSPRGATRASPPAAGIASLNPKAAPAPPPVDTPAAVEAKTPPEAPLATPTVAATPQPTPSAVSADAAPPAAPQPPASPDTSPEALAAAPAPSPTVASADEAPSAAKSPSPSQDVVAKNAAAPAVERPDGGGAAEVATAAPGKGADDGPQILIVLTKAEVKDVAELHDKSVVVAGVAAFSDARLKAAFAAAGANGAEFRRGAVNDVDEVESGQVAAAIVAVVKPEIAGAFPEVPGYRVLRVEVAPEASR